jgi:hypothetical protein
MSLSFLNDSLKLDENLPPAYVVGLHLPPLTTTTSRTATETDVRGHPPLVGRG